MNYIDYSQHHLWKECPWKWYERYVRGLSQKYDGPRDDALAIGSAYHSGMENWYGKRKIQIAPKVLEDLCLTKEAHDLVMHLLVSYSIQYPNDPWPVISIEEPVTRKLFGGSGSYSLVAKIDQEFRIEEPTTIASGWGENLVLDPGVWTNEFKTKGASVDIGHYVMGYRFNLQPSYQLLALQAKHGTDARGVLMNVVEKPQVYIPRRKCKACGRQSPYSQWVVTSMEDKVFMCPQCKGTQILQPPKDKEPDSPKFFRFPVYRSDERLAVDLDLIVATAKKMQTARDTKDVEPNWDSCVTTIPKRICEFAEAHGVLSEAISKNYIQRNNPLYYVFGENS